MKLLSALELLEINRQEVENTGGLYVPRTRADIEPIVGRVLNAIDYEQINNVYELAAFYCQSIATGHRFSDGNKRTATQSLFIVLDINDHATPHESKHLELEELIVSLAQGHIDYIHLANWLQQ